MSDPKNYKTISIKNFDGQREILYSGNNAAKVWMFCYEIRSLLEYVVFIMFYVLVSEYASLYCSLLTIQSTIQFFNHSINSSLIQYQFSAVLYYNNKLKQYMHFFLLFVFYCIFYNNIISNCSLSYTMTYTILLKL